MEASNDLQNRDAELRMLNLSYQGLSRPQTEFTGDQQKFQKNTAAKVSGETVIKKRLLGSSTQSWLSP